MHKQKHTEACCFPEYSQREYVFCLNENFRAAYYAIFLPFSIRSYSAVKNVRIDLIRSAFEIILLHHYYDYYGTPWPD